MITVDRIVLREIRLRLREPFRISSGIVDERRILLLELLERNGISEWAECVAGEHPNYSPETIDTAWLAIREWLAPRLLGKMIASPDGVHEMLDPQVDGVRAMSDEVAERIATMGGEPLGTPGAVVAFRSWDDYDLNRAPAVRHLSALDDVYSGVIADHRRVIEELGDLDPITEDLFIGHTRDLELYQWFVRAHLKDADGDVTFRQVGKNGRGQRTTTRPPKRAASKRSA